VADEAEKRSIKVAEITEPPRKKSVPRRGEVRCTRAKNEWTTPYKVTYDPEKGKGRRTTFF